MVTVCIIHDIMTYIFEITTCKMRIDVSKLHGEVPPRGIVEEGDIPLCGS